MASRYWVGGTGSWNASNTANWSATSGGAGGASVPTVADDVFFNASSGTGTVTANDLTNTALSLNFTGYTGTFTRTTTVTVAGSVTLSAGMTFTASADNLLITGTGTLTSAGKNMGTVTINAPGGTVTLGDAFATNVYPFTLTAGTFSTSASNYTFTVGNFTSVGSSTRTLTLNGSTVSAASWNVASTGMTLNAGTSTVNVTDPTGSFSGAGFTYNNVGMTSTVTGQVQVISGANTINTLTLTSPNSSGVRTFDISDNQTITTMVCTGGATAARRMFLRSSTIGFPVSLTVTTWSTISDVDFRDITMNTARSGTRLGNCGGNTNITFSAAKTVYWNLAGTQNWSANGWATSSGGAPSNTNFPLAQDTAVFDNTGSAGTITIDSLYNLPAVNMSARTTAMTLNDGGLALFAYGSWSNGSGTTLSFTGSLNFAGTTTQVITSAGKSFAQVSLSRGGMQLADAMTLSGVFYFNSYSALTLNLNNFNLTCSQFRYAVSGSNTIAFGSSGAIYLTGTGSSVYQGSTWTLTGSKNVYFTYAGASAMDVSTSGVTTESNAPNFFFTAGTYIVTIGGSSVIGNIDFTGFAGSMDSAGNFTVYGNFTASTGMTFASAALTTVFAATSGTKTIDMKGKTYNRNVTFNGVGGTWQLLSNWVMTDTTKTVTLTNGTLDLNGSTFTVGSFVTASGTKNITFNGGTLIVINSGSTAFNNAQPTNFTTTAGTGTGTIRMSSATAKTFVGGGSTFNCTLDQGGAGTLTITGSNTFSNITASYTATAACSILFTAATTSTFSNWNASGTVGKLLTIGSVTAASHTLSKSSGIVSANYLSISRSTATGGATWYAGANSTNGGNNTGWIFSNAPSATANFLMFFM